MILVLTVWGVIGGILRWIGILLLCLVALIFLLLLFVLLSPIRYRIDADKQGNSLDLQAKVTYLLHLIRMDIVFRDKKLKYQVKLAWKTVAASEKSSEDAPAELPAEGEKPETEAEAKPETAHTAVGAGEPSSEAAAPSKAEVQPAETSSGAAPPTATAPVSLGKVTIASPASEEESLDSSKAEKAKLVKRKKKRRKTFAQSVDESMELLLAKLENLEDWVFDWTEKLLDLPDSAEEMFDKKTAPLRCAYRMYEGYPRKKETLQAILLLLWRILRRLLPRKMRLEAAFGTGDPFSSAQILGAYEAAYPLVFYKNRKADLDLQVNLEEKQLEASGFLSGHFMLQSILWALILALLNSDIRRLIRFVRKLKERKKT